MKTSIFNMTFVLPPLIGMPQVEKDMPSGTNLVCSLWPFQDCSRPT